MFNIERAVELMTIDTLFGGATSNMIVEEFASSCGEIKGWSLAPDVKPHLSMLLL